MKTAIALFFLFLMNTALPLEISEIFYRSDAFVRNEDRYIEIYNNGESPFDLSQLILTIPAGSQKTTNVGVTSGKFNFTQNDIFTNSLLLAPGQCAVVLSEEYNSFARLHSFAAGTLLLKPKNQSFTGWSWSGRLGMIQLLSSNTVIFDCASWFFPPESAIPPGESLTFNGSGYSVSGRNAGIHNQCWLTANVPLLHPGQSFSLDYFCPQTISNAVEAFITYSSSHFTNQISLPQSSAGHYSAVFQPPSYLLHGEDILIHCGSNTALVRFLQDKPLSDQYQKIIFNELVTDPKIDYSGGGWNGQNGSGIIDSSDDWIELANTSGGTLNLSNYYILYQTEDGETIKRISFRSNSSGGKSGVLSNGGYLVISPEEGLANDAFIALYDNYPYRDGKLVDELAYGKYGQIPSGKSDSAINEALTRIPNAVVDSNPWLVFRKGPASFAKSSGSETGLIWVINCTCQNTNPIYLIDTNNTNTYARVLLKDDADMEWVLLTNRGIYFYGLIRMSQSQGNPFDGLLEVQNGCKVDAVYEDDSPRKSISTHYFWADSGWSVPSETQTLDSAVVFPNPIPKNTDTKIIFANLPQDTEIQVIDCWGNIIRSLSGVNHAAIEWECKLKEGIYIAVIKLRNVKCCKKLLVH